MSEQLGFIAFTIFNTWVLAFLCAILVPIYVWKACCVNSTAYRRTSLGYKVKSINWTVLGLAFIYFNFVPLLEGRAVLRISFGLLILSELAYNHYVIPLVAAHVIDRLKFIYRKMIR